MNANELRDKTPDQLREELANLKKESFNLRFQSATGQLENPARIREARRAAARVKTILNEKPSRQPSKRSQIDANVSCKAPYFGRQRQTVTVSVERRSRTGLKKTIRKSKKYRAHDENNAYKVGDSVRIIECAPRSKTKTLGSSGSLRAARLP